MIRSCNNCGCKLVVEVNWHKSRKDRRDYICKDCVSKYNKKYRKLNRPSILISGKTYRDNNKESIKESKALWYSVNKDRIRDKKNAYGREWNKKNKDKKRYYTAKRRAAKLKRTPEYVDLLGIEFFYLCCPNGYEVDHIVPLQGKVVSGLQLLENLQYLTKLENYSKSNYYNQEVQYLFELIEMEYVK